MARILIADDAMFMRSILKNIFTKNGHEVVGEAASGREAYELYKELKPDVMTMDITMPDVDGIEAVQKIKGEFPDANIIMCSAMGQDYLVLNALKAGARDFIVKPFKPDTVIAAIEKVVGK